MAAEHIKSYGRDIRDILGKISGIVDDDRRILSKIRNLACSCVDHFKGEAERRLTADVLNCLNKMEQCYGKIDEIIQEARVKTEEFERVETEIAQAIDNLI